MSIIYLGLGSNLGDRFDNLDKATGLVHLHVGEVLESSQIYETEPWGLKSQPEFLNAVVKVGTKLSPSETLERCLEIELKLGRVRFEKWGERIIDIDLLFYGGEIIQNEKLVVPHPYLHERLFVLVPLSEVSNGLKHPQTGQSVKEMLESCPGKLNVKAIREESLKRIDV